MNDLVLVKDLKTLEQGQVEGARAHPPMFCPKCHKFTAQVMDGYVNQELRLYFNCPDCGAQACIVHKLTSSDCEEISNAGMTHIQRKFFVKAWSKLHEPEPKVDVLSCEDKKLLDTGSFADHEDFKS